MSYHGVIHRAAMTDTQVERVAREWCHLAGLDADEMVGHGAKANAQGYVPAVWLQSPRWMLVADNVREREMMDRAFDILALEAPRA